MKSKLLKKLDHDFYAEFQGLPTLTGALRGKIISFVDSALKEQLDVFIKGNDEATKYSEYEVHCSCLGHYIWRVDKSYKGSKVKPVPFKMPKWAKEYKKYKIKINPKNIENLK